MSSVTGGPPASESQAGEEGPEPRARSIDTHSPLARVLSLREGSIIVVAIVTAVYFSLRPATS